MKAVAPPLTLATLAFTASAAICSPKVPSAKILDMYAVKEGDNYVVHVLASADISRFMSDRKDGEETYRLTLDVPAVSPTPATFDVETPFSRQLQVWPMQLGKRIYSRIEIEIDLEASSVVGLENASHLFVRIRKAPPLGVLVAATTKARLPRRKSPPGGNRLSIASLSGSRDWRPPSQKPARRPLLQERRLRTALPSSGTPPQRPHGRYPDPLHH